MKTTAVLSAGLLASAAFAQQSGPACKGLSYDFSNFGGTLSYNAVTKYSFTMADCKQQEKTIKSPIAPLDQGLTAVFRGPLKLKQFAVYNEASSSKRDAKSSPRERRHHNHERFHKKHAAAQPEEDDLEKRGCGDPVTAIIDGKPVTWANSYNCGGGAAATPAPAAPAANTPAANTPAVAAHVDVAVASSKASSAPAAPSASSAPSSGSSNTGGKGGAWNRVSYYSASSKTASALTFLYPIQYNATGFLPANGDTTGAGASSPQTLGDVLIPDNSRFYINSANKMANNPGSGEAYHGFSGNKIMLVEMTMPKSGSSAGQYPDMPAFWLLNEELPATSDSAQCNCWASGCGEWDIHEVLTKGADIGYSTMHMGTQYCGGADNGFKRVTSGTQKLAVIIKAGSTGKDSVVKIIQLDDSYDFGEGISESDYQKWVSTPTAGGEKGSVNAPCNAPQPAFS